MMSMFYTLAGLGHWQPERQRNLLDGSMPFYRCYKTQDEKFIAVGCIEPQFFTEMLSKLDINSEEFGKQNDRTQHAYQHKKLEGIFASQPRQYWADLFSGSDACVTPVLNYEEATKHPQNIARGGLKQQGQFTHPRSAPAFASSFDDQPANMPGTSDDTQSILTSLKYSEEEILAMKDEQVAL